VRHQALAELRHRIRCFLNFSEAAARSVGIEPQQHQMLLAIRGLPDGMQPTILNLAERLQVKHHTAVGLLDRLERRALIVRRRSKKDQREVRIVIRPAGDLLLKKLSIAHEDELKAQGPALLKALTAIVRPRKPARKKEKK